MTTGAAASKRLPLLRFQASMWSLKNRSIEALCAPESPSDMRRISSPGMGWKDFATLIFSSMYSGLGIPRTQAVTGQ